MKTKHWGNLGEITVKSWDGSTKVYPSLAEAVRCLNFAQSGYYSRYNDVVKYDYLQYYSKNPLYRDTLSTMGGGSTKMFYTSEGVAIPGWKVLEVYDHLPWKTVPPRYRRRGNYNWGTFEFRNGPVNGIACRKAGRYRGYRRIHTYSQRREADFFDHYDEDAREYGLKVRCKRNRANLPTSWDDITVKDYYKKSWKNYRDHQWKPK